MQERTQCYTVGLQFAVSHMSANTSAALLPTHEDASTDYTFDVHALHSRVSSVGSHLGTHHLISLVCTASGNASQAWQNLGQNKTRLAIGLSCQSTESQIVTISQRNTAAGLI